jgi:multisubunit Na+/H+ antiporter MnhB subunit
MNKIKLAVLAFAMLVGVGALTPVSTVSANANSQILEGANRTGTQGGPTLEARVATITGVLLFVVGAISVIMIIVGGIKYVTSAGDASKITSAKNTIMYSVVGLILSILAYAIVNFVIRQFVN